MPHRRAVLLLSVVLAGLAGAWLVHGRERAALQVELATARKQAVFRSHVDASGQVVAARWADVGSSVMGRLVELRVKEGDAVRAGQVLARIDPVQPASQARAAAALLEAAASDAAAAEARAREASRNLERLAALHGQALAPQADLDAARADADASREQAAAAERRVAQARAEVRRTRDLVEKTEITSPLSGTVTRLAVREGEMVVVGVQNQPGTILMTVSDLSAVDAEVKVAEAEVLRLEVGQPATVTLETLPGRELPGRVLEVGSSALPTPGATTAAREFRVLVRLEAKDVALRPGLTCDARILVREARDALTVPLQAVVLRPGPGGAERTGVFLVRDGRAAFAPVRAGDIGGLDVQVEGLAEGASLVSGPFQALRELEDGRRVVEQTR